MPIQLIPASGFPLDRAVSMLDVATDNPYGPSGTVLKLDANTEANLVAAKLANRNVAAGVWSILKGYYPDGAPLPTTSPMPDVIPNWPYLAGWNYAAKQEAASRVLAPEDSCRTSVCQGSPTFTINPGTLTEGFLHVFVGACSFTGAGGVAISDQRVATLSAWIPRPQPLVLGVNTAAGYSAAAAQASPFFRPAPAAYASIALPILIPDAPSIGCILAQSGTDTFVLTSF